jgi:hypothetical protein
MKIEPSWFAVEVSGIELTPDQADAIQNEMSKIVARRVAERSTQIKGQAPRVSPKT